jgi:NADPH-dependent curcumin reductase CurA
MSDVNRQIRLASRPQGMLTPDVWELSTEPVPEPAEGEVVVAVELLSLDPAMRGWLNDVPSYVPPVGLGEVMRAGGVGRVLSSCDERFAAGDWVAATTGVQEYAALRADTVTPIDVALAAPQTYLGALGISGMTAYFGLLDVGRLAEGETVVVSGATCWMPLWRGWPAAGGSRSAGRSPSTTPRAPCRVRRTTSPCWSSARR